MRPLFTMHWTSPNRDRLPLPRPSFCTLVQLGPHYTGTCSNLFIMKHVWLASYWNAFLLLPANEVCEGYVFTPVCQSSCSQGWGVPGHPPSRYTSLGRYTPPREQCMLGDTGNKRAVRILLECFLVLIILTCLKPRHCAGSAFLSMTQPSVHKSVVVLRKTMGLLLTLSSTVNHNQQTSWIHSTQTSICPI